MKVYAVQFRSKALVSTLGVFNTQIKAFTYVEGIITERWHKIGDAQIWANDKDAVISIHVYDVQ